MNRLPELNKYDRFFTLEEINPKLGKLLTERYDEIKAEFDENRHLLKTHNWAPETGYEGVWNKVPWNGWEVAPMLFDLGPISKEQREGFLDGVKSMWKMDVEYNSANMVMTFSENTKLLPTLYRTALECGVRRRFGLSIFHPDGYIRWHVDPDPETQSHAIIRGCWGLEINEEEGKDSCLLLGDASDHVSWKLKNNECRLIWGRTNHRLDNNGISTPRYCFIFDNEVPFTYLDSIL